MSMSAYIYTEKVKIIDGEIYKNEDEEYIFDYSHQRELVDKMTDYGAENFCGEMGFGSIEMGYECFESMIENEKFSKEEWGIIQTIMNWFEENDENWLVLKCY